MTCRRGLSRRTFLQSTAAVTAGVFSAPLVLPRRVFGANDRPGLAFIGVRNQGTNNLNAFLRQPCDVVALCDVDADVLAKAALIVQKAGRVPVLEHDFRRLLDRSDVDAVVITTPDHWHALMTIAACQAGKDVYCEKPLTLTIAEGRRMVSAARNHGRVVQTGSQQRSAPEFRKACELVRNGAIGTVHTVLAGLPGPNHPGPLGPDSNPPAALDYDAWLGPAPARPYNEKRVHYNFRFWWDYSGGQMTNFGAHHIDIAQWGLGMDDSGPVHTEGVGTFHPEHVHEVTETCRVTHTYASGTKLIVGQEQSDIPEGTTFLGDKGRIHVNRGKLTSEPKEIVESSTESFATRLAVSDDHHRNFLNAMGSRERPIADVETGHRSATVCHLGNIAIRLGRPVAWDPVKEEIPNDAEAQSMLERPYREPYHRL